MKSFLKKLFFINTKKIQVGKMYTLINTGSFDIFVKNDDKSEQILPDKFIVYINNSGVCRSINTFVEDGVLSIKENKIENEKMCFEYYNNFNTNLVAIDYL